ncbi:hypothetical protein A2875_01620 [Candidatus Gottesmanbacteria bacterium RIFCSPHIGHO2_01_FULL_46_14]|uniref:Uncharacterized protein n=2 Tax=Candidatus Gottesmaniibacteriota TaxID=1752720 RepID=A0A1F5ZJN1_9BACT|nr:MAG: hypothetical protein UX71_C0016G0003 [Parcubacteria group bacterium GW2011_GWA1_47_10]OGG12699.1 MAG: hypothetical protein A2875_01620 [Candidatus Gottesmanbacteria bacterium RIFCSPHIGHO2_01_FULL_46_14]OGG29038.1 MAG: hypothetical protein A2971_03750 [Candidatus Gottesmanbacteria bacterium RIFCSPLOWO2_01_FULL_46_21]
MSEVSYFGSSEPTKSKEVIAPRFDAVIACGMGPMELKASHDPKTNPVPSNVFNYFNAVATKNLVARGWAREGILSGYHSRQTQREGIRTDVALEELARSESSVLAHIFDQTRPKDTDIEAVKGAAKLKILEENAKTTFGNIFEGLNLLDRKDPQGYFSGSFGVVSSEFHGPRIAEMFQAFGLTNGRFISAEGVLRASGYMGGARGWGPTYDGYNRGAYPGQPAGLQNLVDNPSYVTRDLAVIDHPRRFHEVAHALKSYYSDRPDPAALPDCFSELPKGYDPSFPYEALKRKFADVPFTKHDYVGNIEAARIDYRRRAQELSEQTRMIL